MTNTTGKTNTQRGLGWDHTLARRAALEALREGEPCPKCGQPMFHPRRRRRFGWLATLDLDHQIPRCMGGADGPTRLVHARCNRIDGGKLGGRFGGKARKKAVQPQKTWVSRW